MDLKSKILSAQKQIERVDIEGWEFPVFIRRMTLAERGVFADAAEAARASGDHEQSRATTLLVLQLTVCDEEGRKAFDDPSELKALDAVIADKLAMKALQVNKLVKGEETEKKSESGETSGLNSTSPASSENPAPSSETK